MFWVWPEQRSRKEAQERIAIGVQIMRVMALIMILQISRVIYMGCLRGAGDVLYTTMASTISVTLIRSIAGYLLCYMLGPGIWFGILADQIFLLLPTK